jgi:hypothetical protein
MATMTTLQLDQTSLDQFLNLSASVVAPAPARNAQSDTSGKPSDDVQDLDELEVRTLLGRTDSGLRRDAAWVLLQPVRLAVLLGKASSEQYRDLNEVWECLRHDTTHNFIVPLSDEGTWKQALAIGRRRRQNSGHDFFGLELFGRERAVADALKRLDAQGYPSTPATYGVSFSDATLLAITNTLDRMISQVGGRAAVDAMLSLLAKTGRIYRGAFLAGRTINYAHANPRPPSIPVHYIYNLGLKHLTEPPASHRAQHHLTSAVELARDMGAAFDVETYSAFTNVNISPSALHRKLLDNVLFDELFAFHQWVPTVADGLQKSWLRRLGEQRCIPHAVTADQLISFCSGLQARAHISRLEVVHPAEFITPDLSGDLVRRLFKTMATQGGALNRDYLSPFDTAKRNSPYFPIYYYSTELYVIPPKCIVTRAFCERVSALIREEKIADYESKLGKALELLTSDVLSASGHTPERVSAQYRTPTQKKAAAPLELDVALGLDDNLFLFECKSKVLTNASCRGDSMRALLDLARGFCIRCAKA